MMVIIATAMAAASAMWSAVVEGIRVTAALDTSTTAAAADARRRAG